jgi:hypothetical protein
MQAYQRLHISKVQTVRNKYYTEILFFALNRIHFLPLYHHFLKLHSLSNVLPIGRTSMHCLRNLNIKLFCPHKQTFHSPSFCASQGYVCKR